MSLKLSKNLDLPDEAVTQTSLYDTMFEWKQNSVKVAIKQSRLLNSKKEARPVALNTFIDVKCAKGILSAFDTNKTSQELMLEIKSGLKKTLNWLKGMANATGSKCDWLSLKPMVTSVFVAVNLPFSFYRLIILMVMASIIELKQTVIPTLIYSEEDSQKVIKFFAITVI